MINNAVVYDTLNKLSPSTIDEFKEYETCDLEKAIVTDLYGIDGISELTWEQIDEKYKDVYLEGQSLDTKYILEDRKNIANKAYCGLKCVIGTRLYNDKITEDLEFARKQLENMPRLRECFNLTEGITDEQLFNQLIGKEIKKFDVVIRLTMLTGALQLAIKAQKEIELNQDTNSKVR